MNVELLFSSIVVIGLSLIPIFNRDSLWKWWVRNMRSGGLKAENLERTPEWDFGIRNLGIIFLVMGIAGIIMAILPAILYMIR